MTMRQPDTYPVHATVNADGYCIAWCPAVDHCGFTADDVAHWLRQPLQRASRVELITYREAMVSLHAGIAHRKAMAKNSATAAP